MPDKHTVLVNRLAVIRLLKRSRPCTMSLLRFFRRECFLALPFSNIVSGIALSSVFVLMAWQNHTLRCCKEKLEQDLTEVLNRESAAALSHAESRAEQNLKLKSLRKRVVALSLLAEGRRRRHNRAMRQNVKLILFCSRFFMSLREQLENKEIARKSFATLANNRFVLLEEAQKQLLPKTMTEKSSVVTLGSIKPKPNPADFVPPANWKDISTTDSPYPLNIMIEAYKKIVRARNAAEPAQARPESSLMAECRFWEVKKAIPKAWLEMEVPEPVRKFLEDYNPRKHQRVERAATNHSNGSKVHNHSSVDCARNAVVSLDDSKTAVRPSLQTSKSSKEKPEHKVKVPPILVPPPPKVVFLEVQKREQELKDTCSVVIADKSAKSAIDKLNHRENKVSLEFGNLKGA